MFSVIELQTTGGQTTHLYQTAPTLQDAMSKYHLVLASATVSEIDYHACVVLNEAGVQMARESYNHVEESNEE